MANHPNRSRNLPWVQFLPEVGTPMLDRIRRIQEMEAQIAEARKSLNADIAKLWTPEEIREARLRAERDRAAA